MEISAKVVADSVSVTGVRLITMQLCYPRMIHSEFMTHRVFSRNAMSSRAVPVKTMIEQVRHDPFVPLFWGTNKPGMQAGAELEGSERRDAIDLWLWAAKDAAKYADCLQGRGVHKQNVNRLLEPFQWMHTVVTATKWDNFFRLRDHWMAEPHICLLAKRMKKAQEESEPRLLVPGVWHLPYVGVDEMGWHDIGTLLAFSTARCARVSYNNHDGTKPDPAKDVKLYQDLVIRPEGNHDPEHMSPAEHQASPDYVAHMNTYLHGNFHGWVQHRKFLEAKLEPSRWATDYEKAPLRAV